MSLSIMPTVVRMRAEGVEVQFLSCYSISPMTVTYWTKIIKTEILGLIWSLRVPNYEFVVFWWENWAPELFEEDVL